MAFKTIEFYREKKSEVKMVIELNNAEESKPWILKMVGARKES